MSNQELRSALADFDEGNFNSAGITLVGLYKKEKEAQGKARKIVRYHLARVYFEKEMYAKAKHLLDGVVEEDPTNFSAWYQLALVLEADDNLDQARRALGKIPDSASNYKSASKILADIEKQAEIRRKIDEFSAIHGRSLDEKELLGLAMVVEDLEKLELCSNREMLYIKLAGVYRSTRSARLQDLAKEKPEISILEGILGQYVRNAGFNA